MLTPANAAISFCIAPVDASSRIRSPSRAQILANPVSCVYEIDGARTPWRSYGMHVPQPGQGHCQIVACDLGMIKMPQLAKIKLPLSIDDVITYE
jgi:hypothetical protein